MEKNGFSKITKKFSFVPDRQFYTNCGYISGSALRIFFRLCSMIGYNQERKINQTGISQKILLWAKCAILASLWPNIMQSYIWKSILRIFFVTLQLDRAQQVDKNHLTEIPSKILFWAKLTVLVWLWCQIIGP